MVQLVEITGVLNEKGCIEIPIVLLAQTGIRTGEEVNLIYLAAGEKDYRNESREFMLKRAEEDPLEELQSGETELKLPPQLLADAHIPLDADLDIVCEFEQQDGARNHAGRYQIHSWGAIDMAWIGQHLAQIKQVLGYP